MRELHLTPDRPLLPSLPRKEPPDRRCRVDLARHPPHPPPRLRAARPGVPAAFYSIELDRPPVSAAEPGRMPHARAVGHAIGLVGGDRRAGAPRERGPEAEAPLR